MSAAVDISYLLLVQSQETEIGPRIAFYAAFVGVGPVQAGPAGLTVRAWPR